MQSNFIHRLDGCHRRKRRSKERYDSNKLTLRRSKRLKGDEDEDADIHLIPSSSPVESCPSSSDVVHSLIDYLQNSIVSLCTTHRIIFLTKYFCLKPNAEVILMLKDTSISFKRLKNMMEKDSLRLHACT